MNSEFPTISAALLTCSKGTKLRLEGRAKTRPKFLVKEPGSRMVRDVVSSPGPCKNIDVGITRSGRVRVGGRDSTCVSSKNRATQKHTCSDKYFQNFEGTKKKKINKTLPNTVELQTSEIEHFFDVGWPWYGDRGIEGFTS